MPSKDQSRERQQPIGPFCCRDNNIIMNTLEEEAKQEEDSDQSIAYPEVFLHHYSKFLILVVVVFVAAT